MTGQELTVGILIALASLYVLRTLGLSLTKKGCGTGCGSCAEQPTSNEQGGRIPLKQIR